MNRKQFIESQEQMKFGYTIILCPINWRDQIRLMRLSHGLLQCEVAAAIGVTEKILTSLPSALWFAVFEESVNADTSDTISES